MLNAAVFLFRACWQIIENNKNNFSITAFSWCPLDKDAIFEYLYITDYNPLGKDERCGEMKETTVYKRYIVDEQILPEAILKTAQTKELLAKFPGLTINEAVKQIGLSRSAFYKYRDGIFPFYEAIKEKIVTIQINMEHEAGILSNWLNTVAAHGANILTINQGIPTEGIARVTISFESHSDERYNLELMLESLYDIPGVLKVEPIGQN